VWGYYKTSKSYGFLSSWDKKQVSFFIKDAKNTILHKERLYYDSIISYISNSIDPRYNKEKKVFEFKVFKYYKDDDQYELKTFLRYRIQYLVPVSATEDKMVFSGL